MKAFFAGAIFALLGLASAGEFAVDLEPANFDDYIGKKATFVKFYAPWCGHCKSMAADWETLAETFRPFDKVAIAEVNADEYRDLGSRFGVRGFPTIKYFPEGSTEPIDYNGGRSVDELIAFVNEQAGTNKKIKKTPSSVHDLSPSTFDSVVSDNSKIRLVEFFAPWCGHCKNLAPTYEKVAAAFAGEPNVVIAKVDADKHRSLGERFGVEGFPTIKYFAAGAEGSLEEQAEDYPGGRSAADFMDFINEKAGTFRKLDGSLLPIAGRVSKLDEIAKKYIEKGADKKALAEEAKAVAADLTGQDKTNADQYFKIMAKVDEKGDEYVAKEITRLENILKGNVAVAKRTGFELRRNALQAFAGVKAVAADDSIPADEGNGEY